MKRTNIFLTDKQHQIIKRYSRKEGRTIALEAYKEGLMSLGRLAEILGLNPVSTRDYLFEKGIAIEAQDYKDILKDIKNA